MKWPLLLFTVLLIIGFTLIARAGTISLLSTPPVNPPAYSYFYIEFQFLPTNNTPQPYAIFVGPNPNNLTEVAEGYTLSNGTGYARVPVINAQTEYVDIVWVNQNYTMFEIFPQIQNATTTVTLSANNNQGFSFSLPTWVSWVIGAVLMLIFMGVGWKFMGPAGLAIFGIFGLFIAMFFGLLPSYLMYVILFIVAIVGARILTKQLGGGEE
ncbi:hypothetical protein [Sulfolobus sp. E11-6]|uniref:Uncharacterized protein n=1 Tax=Sulfolobus spindle-shaped virus SSV19 TaxID=3035230 RepID=A0ACD6BAC6_9VIRU|nr:hypothetical protein [Sulfolobus sp. E11-6]QGA67425.1 hypothetical protein GFS33_00055 [Sulfolobus sp. E11-6]QGA69588.1 hypothetical protein GFS33_13635 [Sulfolobus sp. E11-6]QGA87226.1 hypothetical protein [Sulfolobus spindle-shaped virus SSV19]7XDI_E Chain E, B210 [Sulfolobus spindle-shaped virus]